MWRMTWQGQILHMQRYQVWVKVDFSAWSPDKRQCCILVASYLSFSFSYLSLIFVIFVKFSIWPPDKRQCSILARSQQSRWEPGMESIFHSNIPPLCLSYLSLIKVFHIFLFYLFSYFSFLFVFIFFFICLFDICFSYLSLMYLSLIFVINQWTHHTRKWHSQAESSLLPGLAPLLGNLSPLLIKTPWRKVKHQRLLCSKDKTRITFWSAVQVRLLSPSHHSRLSPAVIVESTVPGQAWLYHWR